MIERKRLKAIIAIVILIYLAAAAIVCITLFAANQEENTDVNATQMPTWEKWGFYVPNQLNMSIEVEVEKGLEIETEIFRTPVVLTTATSPVIVTFLKITNTGDPTAITVNHEMEDLIVPEASGSATCNGNPCEVIINPCHAKISSNVSALTAYGLSYEWGEPITIESELYIRLVATPSFDQKDAPFTVKLYIAN